jgi:rare lipoprotein A
VQIGAFLDPADAIQLKNDLVRRYATAKVIEFQGPTGYWVRIMPGSQDRATADRVAENIHIPDPGAQPYLVRLN